MRFVINATIAAALFVPALLSAQALPAPACRAQLDDGRLLTTIEFSDGYSVEGPWTVLDNRPGPLHDGRNGRRVAASLDRIVEVDPAGRRTPTSFPDPIRTTFEGRDEAELIEQAAQVWCLTVLKVRGEEPLPGLEQARAARVTRVTD